MKNPHVVMTLIFSVALVISAAFLGLGLASLGRGIQTAGDLLPSARIANSRTLE